MSADCECEEVKCPEGIPAWVMTFADLMSLLLAFFVLLFSFSEIDKQAYKQMAGSMKDAFGVQREIKAKEPPRGNNIIAVKRLAFWFKKRHMVMVLRMTACPRRLIQCCSFSSITKLSEILHFK